MKRLIHIFNIMVIIIPLIMALCFALVYFTGGWERWFPEHTLEFYFELPLTGRLSAAGFFLVVGVTLAGVKLLIDRYVRRWEYAELCLIVLLALVFRLVVIIPQTLVPFSDFNRVWEMVHGNMEGNIEYYSLFPAYLNFTVLLRDYLGITGDSFTNTLYLNVVLSTGTSIVVYLISREMTEDKTVPFITGLLYALMPASILYCSVMTPEFITVFFDSFGVLLILKSMKRVWGSKKVGLLIMAGICIGIGSAYKSFGIIILIAMTMCFAAKVVLEQDGWKGILICIAAVVLVFSGYKAAKSIIQLHTERELDIQLDESKSFPHFLLIGLNTEGEGQIHIGTMSRRYYETYLENGLDAEAAKQTAHDLLKTDWTENKETIPKLILDKMIWAWQDDSSPILYYNLALDRENQDITLMGLSIATLTHVFYMIILAGAVLSCLFTWEDTDLKKEFLLLIIFGYLCLILLSEAQSRYKYLIMPFICVISGIWFEGKDFKSLRV